MKRMTYFVMALALVLGFTQCKKEQTPANNETEGVFITLNVKGGNNGSRVIVDPNAPQGYATVTFEDGDVIYVGNAGAYCGYLTFNGTNFTGTVNPTSTADYLHFYFMGNKGPADSAPTEAVSITDQTVKYPVISYAHSTDLYSSTQQSYTAKLKNYCSIVKFTTNAIDTETAITVKGMQNTVSVDFGANNAATSTLDNNPYTPGNSGTGDIILHAVSTTERWAILLEQDEVTNATVTASGYNNGTCDIPEIANNTYHSTGVSVLLWDGDLSKLTNESTEAFATAADGMTITGTLGVNKKVSIADGATVTLDGVTINGENNSSYSWAGITCLGNANINLSGENTVKGFYQVYPGIYVPSGNTLTISGSGSLDVSSNGMGAGIGSDLNGSCGNISITGGTIDATGGEYAAGIGGGLNSSCGNISITGGTIEATGGGFAAGIGCGGGYESSCGSITITNGVTSVTAKRGVEDVWTTCKCIGISEYSTCGTVTIGGIDYGTTGADPNQDDNITFIYPEPAGPVTWTMSSSFSCNTENPYTEGGITASLVAGVVTGEGNSGMATWEISGDYGNINLQSGLDYSWPPAYIPSSLTFTSSDNITKIVILCGGGSEVWPDGWSKINNDWPNPSELIWEGTPSQTVTLSTTDDNNPYISIYSITKIKFYVEE